MKMKKRSKVHNYDNRCVCCGEIIPEGLMVCPVCEGKYD